MGDLTLKVEELAMDVGDVDMGVGGVATDAIERIEVSSGIDIATTTATATTGAAIVDGIDVVCTVTDKDKDVAVMDERLLVPPQLQSQSPAACLDLDADVSPGLGLGLDTDVDVFKIPSVSSTLSVVESVPETITLPTPLPVTVTEPVLLVHEPTEEESAWYLRVQEMESSDESVRNRILKGLTHGIDVSTAMNTLAPSKTPMEPYFVSIPYCDRIYDRVNAVFNCTQKPTPFSVPSSTTPLHDIISIFVDNYKAKLYETKCTGAETKCSNIFIHLMEVYLADKQLSHSNCTNIDAIITKSKLQLTKLNKTNKGKASKTNSKQNKPNKPIGAPNTPTASKKTLILHRLQGVYGVDFDSNSNSYYESYLTKQQALASLSHLKHFNPNHPHTDPGDGPDSDYPYRTNRSDSITSHGSYVSSNGSTGSGGSYSLDGSDEESSEDEEEDWEGGSNHSHNAEVDSVCSDCEVEVEKENGGSKSKKNKKISGSSGSSNQPTPPSTMSYQSSEWGR